MSNPVALQTFDKARSLAYWSYIGLLVPIAGVIVGALSKAKLRDLVGSSEQEQRELDSVRSIATWGIIISSIALAISSIGFIVWCVQLTDATNDYNQAVERSQRMLNNY